MGTVHFNRSIAGMKQGSKELLIELGRTLGIRVEEIVGRANDIGRLLDGMDKNDISNGISAQLQGISDVANSILEGLREVVCQSMREVKRNGDNINSQGMINFADEVTAVYTAIEIPRYAEPRLTVGGSELSVDGQEELVGAMKALAGDADESLRSIKGKVTEVIECGELYSTAIANTWNEMRPMRQQITEISEAYQKNAVEAASNAWMIDAKIGTRASETMSDAGRKAAGIKDTARKDIRSAVSRMV